MHIFVRLKSSKVQTKSAPCAHTPLKAEYFEWLGSVSPHFSSRLLLYVLVDLPTDTQPWYTLTALKPVLDMTLHSSIPGSATHPPIRTDFYSTGAVAQFTYKFFFLHARWHSCLFNEQSRVEASVYLQCKISINGTCGQQHEVAATSSDFLHPKCSKF
jgi:hypothetical protein